jgi:hypothetical protein
LPLEAFRLANLLTELGADIHYVCPKHTTTIYMTVIWDGGDINELGEKLLKAGVNSDIGLEISGETPPMRAGVAPTHDAVKTTRGLRSRSQCSQQSRIKPPWESRSIARNYECKT